MFKIWRASAETWWREGADWINRGGYFYKAMAWELMAALRR